MLNMPHSCFPGSPAAGPMPKVLPTRPGKWDSDPGRWYSGVKGGAQGEKGGEEET